MKKFIIYFGMLFICISSSVLASDIPLNIAQSIPLQSKYATPGTIISTSQKGFYASDKEYDPNIYGVVTKTAAIMFETEGTRTYPVITTGQTKVRVSPKNGAIKKGDWITSSPDGIGVKAKRTGYVLGYALEPYNGKDVGLISVSISIHHIAAKNSIRSSILDVLNLSSLATYEEPLTVFRYLIASVLIVVSFVLGFIIFGRVAGSGVQALGRNPLASSRIQTGIILNVTITLGIIIAGLVLATQIIK